MWETIKIKDAHEGSIGGAQKSWKVRDNLGGSRDREELAPKILDKGYLTCTTVKQCGEISLGQQKDAR